MSLSNWTLLVGARAYVSVEILAQDRNRAHFFNESYRSGYPAVFLDEVEVAVDEGEGEEGVSYGRDWGERLRIAHSVAEGSLIVMGSEYVSL